MSLVRSKKLAEIFKKWDIDQHQIINLEERIFNVSKNIQTENIYNVAREIYKRVITKDVSPYDKKDLERYEWKTKRLNILNRDQHKCKICNSNKNLNVHHMLYFPKKSAWDYEDDYLISLCENCHTIEHESGKALWYWRYLELQKIIKNEI